MLPTWTFPNKTAPGATWTPDDIKHSCSIVADVLMITSFWISEKEFIEILLDELINSERINEDEYKLAYQTCTFELIQNYCARDIKEVLKNLKNIDDLFFWKLKEEKKKKKKL